MLTPVDLETTVFRRGFRGYKTSEVQEFMEQVTADFERLYRENKALKDEKERLEAKIAQYQQMEETLRNTLVLAQQTAEEVRNAGQKQADLLLQEAQYRAEQIKNRVREEIQVELQKLANLRQQVDIFRHQFKKFLEGLAETVDKQGDMRDFWEPLQSYYDKSNHDKSTDNEGTPAVTKQVATAAPAVAEAAAAPANDAKELPPDSAAAMEEAAEDGDAEEALAKRFRKTSFEGNEFFKDTGS